MKKAFKKALCGLMAFALVAAVALAVAPTDAKADSVLGTAYIGIGDTNTWSWNFYRGTDGTTENLYAGTDIDGDGTYTVTISTADIGEIDYSNEPTLFYIDMKGLAASLDIEDGSDCDLVVSDVSITCDGSNVSVEQANVILGGGVGQEDDSIRINFINPWSDDDDAVIGTKIEFADTLTVTFTLTGTGVEGTLGNATASAASEGGVIGTAYVGIGDTNTWSWNFYRGTDGTTENLYSGTDIDGDGTYSVSITTAEIGQIDYSNEPTLFYVDIKGLAGYLGVEDIEDCDVVVTDVKVTCDGANVSVEQANVELGVSDEESIRINLMNPWAEDPDATAVIGTKIEFTDTLTVTFTISGTGVEGTLGNAADDTADDAATTDAASTEASSSAISPVIIIVIVVVVILVIVAIVLASKKKKN